ncbi:pogo transposable element with KRAB domain [Trichonephila clavipes]|nr:pogo transposable element with KRAB domain [Trichonephila clavipes]
MDSMKSHVSENVKNALKSASAKIAIIPGGLTIAALINRSFKSKVRKLWEQWMSDGEKNYTKTGKLKRASYENVSRWVLKAWNDVAETTVKNVFRKCNIVKNE